VINVLIFVFYSAAQECDCAFA